MSARKAKKLNVNQVKIFLSPGGHQAIFPNVCPCCLGEVDSSIKIEASTFSGSYRISKQWELPYCSTCKSHARDPVGLIGLALLAVVGLIVFLLLRRLSPSLHGIWVAILSLIVSIF